MSSRDGAVDPLELLLQKRYEMYPKAASLLMAMEDASNIPDESRLVELHHDLRRLVRSATAFCTKQTFAAFDELDVLVVALEEAPESVSFEALRKHLKLLHVALSRGLKSKEFSNLEDILALDGAARDSIRTSEARVAARDEALAREEQQHQLQEEALAAVKAGNLKQALKVLDRAIALDDSWPVLHNDRGYVLGKLGRPEQAIDAYRKACELNEAQPGRRTDEWTSSYRNLAIWLRRLGQQSESAGRDEQALTQYREAMATMDRYLASDTHGKHADRIRAARSELEERAKVIEETLDLLRRS